MIEKILDKLYDLWDSYPVPENDVSDALCTAYNSAIDEVKRGGYDVIRLDGKHFIRVTK